MKALTDKAELKARNKAYKTTLYYCEETCEAIDKLTEDAIHELFLISKFTQDQRMMIECCINTLVDNIKDKGTRKLRHAFVDYVLEKQSEEI